MHIATEQIHTATRGGISLPPLANLPQKVDASAMVDNLRHRPKITIEQTESLLRLGFPESELLPDGVVFAQDAYRWIALQKRKLVIESAHVGKGKLAEELVSIERTQIDVNKIRYGSYTNRFKFFSMKENRAISTTVVKILFKDNNSVPFYSDDLIGDSGYYSFCKDEEGNTLKTYTPAEMYKCDRTGMQRLYEMIKKNFHGKFIAALFIHCKSDKQLAKLNQRYEWTPCAEFHFTDKLIEVPGGKKKVTELVFGLK